MITDTATAISQGIVLEEFLPKHLAKLMALGTEVHFGQDQIIFKENDQSDHFYILLTGGVALEAACAAKTIRLDNVYPRREFGWVAMVNRKRQFQARALEPVTAMEFNVAEVSVACRRDPNFGCAFLERLFKLAVEELERYRTRLIHASDLLSVRGAPSTASRMRPTS
jgi:CRP/FNR family transcriptional regulator, cyclic AMP receptor protein